MYHLRLIIFMMMSILHSLYTLYASPVYSHGRQCLGLHFSLSLWDIGIIIFDRYWGGIIIRSNYDVREIALSLGIASHATILFSSIITSAVYLHSLRFAGRFLRRLCLGCHFLPLWFFLSERLGWGFAPTRHYEFILFHIIASTVYLHSLRFAGLFLRRAMPRSLLFTPLVSSLREIELGGFAPYTTLRIYSIPS